MESGLLPLAEAKKVFEKKQKKIKQQKLSSPMKPGSAVKSSTGSVTKRTPMVSPGSSNKRKTDSKVAPKQTKKRKAEESESSDDDFKNTLASRMKKQKAN